MSFNILGGGEIDGKLGENPDFSQYSGKLGYIYTSSNAGGELNFWIVDTVQESGGQLMANGLYANPIVISSDVIVPQATTTVSGIVRKATQTQMNSGEVDKFPDTGTIKSWLLGLGYGGPLVNTLTDFNDVNNTLFFRADSGATNAPFNGGCNVINMASSAATNTQIAIPWAETVPKAFFRSQALTYSEWVELYHSGNLTHAQNVSGITIESNGAMPGSNLNPAQNGTWRNISGNDILNNGYGLWERI